MSGKFCFRHSPGHLSNSLPSRPQMLMITFSHGSYEFDHGALSKTQAISVTGSNQLSLAGLPMAGNINEPMPFRIL